jgi:hypothetical protein
MSKLTEALKALELLKETGYHKGVLQQKKRRPVGEGAPSTYEKKPVKDVKNPSKKFQQQAAGVTGAKLVGGETVYSDDGKDFYSIKPSNAKTSRGRHIVTSAGKERKKPVFKVPDAPKPSDGGELVVSGETKAGKIKKASKELKDVIDKVKRKQQKRKIKEALDSMKKKKLKKSATQRLLEGIMKKTGALPAKRNIGGVGVNEGDLSSEVSNSFAGNATRTRAQGLSENEIKDDKKLNTIANPTQKSDVEQGVYGNVAGRPTNGLSTDTKVDAPKDYEGQSHDGIRSEQFKYEDKKPKVDDDHKNKAGEFVYSEHVPYKTKSFGAVGVPLTQENTWGMKYATKEEVDEYLSKQNNQIKTEE